MLKRAIAILAVNAIVFCVAGELLALAVFYYQHGWLFYIDPYKPKIELIAETQSQRLTGDRLHPYFGPTHGPGIRFDIPESLRRVQAPAVVTNNFGFVSQYDYPFTKQTDNQFIVGLFGGSVGVWFCQVGATRLLENLKRNDFFKKKELVPLCLSHEGYKQPQQLLLLAYFLSIGQKFDLVINIDGFNEVALSAINDQRGTDISMPSAVHLDPLVNLVNQSTLTPAKLESLAEISRDKQQLNALAERINSARLASVHFVLERYYRIVEKRYRAELGNFDKLPSNPSESSIIHVTPSVRVRQGPALFEDVARQWMDSSAMMKEMLASRGVGYFHFLQPNRSSTQRSFSDSEAQVALSNESPFKESAEKGYPFLVKALASSPLRNRNAFDGTGIFDAEPAPVYVDNCCHYTLGGNEILADFIARTVLSAPRP